MTENEKIYVISHDTRCDGSGALNGKASKSKEKLIQLIEEYTHYKRTEISDIGWQEDGSYADEENIIDIYEQELN